MNVKEKEGLNYMVRLFNNHGVDIYQYENVGRNPKRIFTVIPDDCYFFILFYE